jgi:uncharacterized protein
MQYYTELSRATLVASLMVLVVTAIATAGPFEDVFAAVERGDYSTANWLLRPLADQGNAVAQFDLGFMYDTGHGVMQDYGEAMRWYRLAAQQGNALAQYNLGFMYANGHGVSQAYAEAAKWYLLSAQQGYTWAQFYLGFFLANGQGVPKNLVLAHMWLSLAAASRLNPPYGSLKTIDEKERRALTTLVAGARAKLESQMTPDQIAEAQKLAGEWKPTPEPERSFAN